MKMVVIRGTIRLFTATTIDQVAGGWDRTLVKDFRRSASSTKAKDMAGVVLGATTRRYDSMLARFAQYDLHAASADSSAYCSRGREHPLSFAGYPWEIRTHKAHDRSCSLAVEMQKRFVSGTVGSCFLPKPDFCVARRWAAEGTSTSSSQ